MNPDGRLDHGGQWVDAKTWPQPFQSNPKPLFFKSLPQPSPSSPSSLSSPPLSHHGDNNKEDGNREGGEDRLRGMHGDDRNGSSPCTPNASFLRNGSSLGLMVSNKGGLSQHEPALDEDSHSFSFTHDPSDPVPTIGGNITSGEPLMVGGAFDQVERENFFGCKHPGEFGGGGRGGGQPSPLRSL